MNSRRASARRDFDPAYVGSGLTAMPATFAGSVHTMHEPKLNRVAAKQKDNRDGRCCCLGCRRGREGGCCNHVDSALDQIGRDTAPAVGFLLGERFGSAGLNAGHC
jgi:hypothetical protein